MKLIIKSCIALALFALASPLTSFGQGFILFSSTKATGVWYGWDTGVPTTPHIGDSNLAVSFLWAVSGTPLGGTSATPTNTSTELSWNTVLSDPNFHFATNASTGNIVTVNANNSGVSQGGWGYNGGVSFGLQGTVGGETIEVFAIAWQNFGGAAPDPFTASQLFTAYGHGNMFSYTLGTGSATTSFSAAGSLAFGVGAPEPGSMTLGGLGIATLLILRRRK